MATKRHHYVPRMLLRRFSANPAADNPPLWCLEKGSGRPRGTCVNNEAVVGHYYRLENEEANPALVEDALSIIEGRAKEIIDALVAGQNLSSDQRFLMALFIHLQYMRTPRGRHWMTHLQEMGVRIAAMNHLADPEEVKKHFAEKGEQRTDEEIERWRHEVLERIERGSPRITPTHDGEVAGIFRQADSLSRLIALKMTWTALCPSAGEQYILSDHPVHIVDLEAPPGEGVGYLSSPTVELTFPIDPALCLLLRPGPPEWSKVNVEPEDVRDINLRTYASAQWVIWGPNQQAVQQVRSQAKRNPKRLAQVGVRSPSVVISKRIEGESQPFGLTKHSPQGPPHRGRRVRK